MKSRIMLGRRGMSAQSRYWRYGEYAGVGLARMAA